MKQEYEQVKPEFEKVEEKKKKERTDSYFDGKFIEYVGYKILAFIITAVTFTIAKPWADKLIIEYKINHTLYNGKHLKFEGTGASLFVQRFKWTLLTIITLGIYGLWVPIKKEKWIISNVHFENEELKEGESYFDGKLLGLIGVNIFSYLLGLVSFGLLIPFAVCYKQKWVAKHTVINCKKIVFNGKAMSIIGHYLLWWLLSCVTFGIYAIWVPMKVYGWQVKNTHIKLKDEEYEKQSILPVIIGIVLAVLLVIILVITIPKTDIPALISGDKQIKDIFKGGDNSKINYGNGTNVVPNVTSNTITIYIKNGKGTLVKSYSNNATIADLEIPQKEGFEFVGWTNENGEELRSDYVLSDFITVVPQWKEITNTVVETPITTTVQTTKCDDGFLYDSDYNMCYSINDVRDAYAIHEETEYGPADGIGCPDGYEINYDLFPEVEGYCHRKVNPNY